MVMVQDNSNIGDEPLVVSPRRACHLLDCGTTRLYELINGGELQSFRDGTSRKIVLASIRNYITRQLERSQAA
jgi:hypothetical protein